MAVSLFWWAVDALVWAVLASLFLATVFYLALVALFAATLLVDVQLAVGVEDDARITAGMNPAARASS